MARSSLALDNFNRASGLTNWNVIYQDGGTPTFENSEAIYLISNYGKFEMVWNANAPTDSQSVRVRWKTLGNATTTLWGGVRGGLTTGDCYLVECPANGQPKLQKWQGGSGTLLALLTSATWAIGDDLFVDVENNGSNQPVISVYQNTTLLGTYTDTGGSPFQSGYGVCGSWCEGGSVRIDEFEVYNIAPGVTGTMSSTLSALTMNAVGAVGTAPKRAVFSVGATNEIRDSNYTLVTQNNVPYAVYKATVLTNLGAAIETGTINIVNGACTINISSASVNVGDTVTVLFDDGTNRATRTLVTT